MFALITVAVWYNGLRTDSSFRVAGAFVPYRHVYRIIGGLMGLTLLAAMVFFWMTRDGSGPDFPFIFVLEAVSLTLFLAFWVAQTKEFWNEGLPAEACPTQATWRGPGAKKRTAVGVFAPGW